MKHMKKLLSLAMALAMVMALGVSASATMLKAPSGDDAEGHTFTAYQIFTAEVEEDGSMSSFEWGANVVGNEKSFINALKAIEGFEGLSSEDPMSSAQEVAEAISANSTKADQVAAAIVASARNGSSGTPITASGTTLAPGYYLIEDVANGVTKRSLMAITGQETEDPTIAIKRDTPQVDKKVGVEAADGSITWQNAADYRIGDEIPFKLTATLPSNLADLTSYVLTLHDKQEEGLTFDASSLKVTVGENGKELSQGTDYTLTQNLSDGCTFEISMNAKGIEGLTGTDTIVVTYKATLNDKATYGADGNVNSVKMSYKVNGDPEEETPEKEVTVFTFKLDIHKVDGAGAALPGAAFTLEKNINGEWTAISVVDLESGAAVGDTTTEFAFRSLDVGEYRLVESKAPDGYTKAETIYFKVTADYVADDPNPTLKGLSVQQTNEDGSVVSNETFAPTITLSTGLLDAQIVNYSGITLPSTGGMGTTIFYIIGGVLVAGAVILLITKRRMSYGED